MTSQKKIESNRANAMKSTGPTTELSKRRTRLNALQTGIYSKLHLLPGEDAKAFQVLEAEVMATCTPIGPIELALTLQILANVWRLDRLKKAEYAALKRNEVEVVLDDEMRKERKVAVSHDFDRTLNDLLTLDHGSGDKVPDPDAQALSAYLDANAPAPAYTFLMSFGASSGYRHIFEIDRQIDAATKSLLRLHTALEEIQDRRKITEIRAVPITSTSPAPS